MRILFILLLMFSQLAVADEFKTIFSAGVSSTKHNNCQGNCTTNIDAGGLMYGIGLEWYSDKFKFAKPGIGFFVDSNAGSPHYSSMSVTALIKKTIVKLPVFAGIGIIDASIDIQEGVFIWRERYQLPFITIGIDYPIKIGHVRLSGTILAGNANASGLEIIGYDLFGNPIVTNISRASSITSSTIMLGIVLPL